MAYTSINDLDELYQEDVNGTEYLLVTNEQEQSNKLKVVSMATYLNQAGAELPEIYKNKTLDDITNYVHANAVHHYGTAIQPIPKGSPVKLVFDENENTYKIGISGGTNEQIVGIAEEDIAFGSVGKYIILGELTDFDTSMWNKGDSLYLFNGLLTNEQPPEDIIVKVGYVLESSLNGKILILNIEGSPASSDITIDSGALSFYAPTLQDAIEHFDQVDIEIQNRIDGLPVFYKQDGAPTDTTDESVWVDTYNSSFKFYRNINGTFEWQELLFKDNDVIDGGTF